MNIKNNIPIQEYCNHCGIEISFIRTLNDHGLLELMREKDSYLIDYEQLALLEKYTHLHYDLDINIEGIEAINHLLQQIDHLQSELRTLKNRLNG